MNWLRNWQTDWLTDWLANWLIFRQLNFKTCAKPQRRAIFPHRNLKKVARTGQFFKILTCECASRHSGVRFFNIWTSKIAPRMWFLFILTIKCASRHSGVRFFDISTSKMAPKLSVLYLLTWKCPSRHSGVPFFISLLNRYLRTRRFSEPTFRTFGTTNHWKKHSDARLS